MAIKLIVQGLRRSGTTIFWRTLRQDARLTCFDEPFSQQLQYLPSTKLIYNPQEFHRLLQRDGVAFWERFTPIGANEELRSGFSDRQRNWLRFLADEGEQMMFDTTRCQYKIQDLHDEAPDAVFVHLYRHPASHATSHMLPRRTGRFAGIRRWLDKRHFFTRDGKYNGWQFEKIIGKTTDSLFAHRLAESGIDPATVYALPAVGRLMVYWHHCFNKVEQDGRRIYGRRFVSLNFDAFCDDPLATLGKVYDALEMELPEFDLSTIHPANKPHRHDAAEWKQLAPWSELPDTNP
ncbi:MAG: sulfotransferase [Acidobacteriota bacterium]|nr:sulfotransferase [Acidobacteriota bacterium]